MTWTGAAATDHDIRFQRVEDHEWDIVAWLWQAFRQDLAPVVHGYPYADGRYQASLLGAFPSPDGEGYLARRPHPNTGEDAPVGFALVDGLTGPIRSMAAFWITPPIRGCGFGSRFALEILTGHPGPWQIGFQHDNAAAGTFWRRVAGLAFGPDWVETMEPVPGRPAAPPDHFIRSALPE